MELSNGVICKYSNEGSQKVISFSGSFELSRIFYEDHDIETYFDNARYFISDIVLTSDKHSNLAYNDYELIDSFRADIMENIRFSDVSDGDFGNFTEDEIIEDEYLESLRFSQLYTVTKLFTLYALVAVSLPLASMYFHQKTLD